MALQALRQELAAVKHERAALLAAALTHPNLYDSGDAGYDPHAEVCSSVNVLPSVAPTAATPAGCLTPSHVPSAGSGPVLRKLSWGAGPTTSPAGAVASVQSSSSQNYHINSSTVGTAGDAVAGSPGMQIDQQDDAPGQHGGQPGDSTGRGWAPTPMQDRKRSSNHTGSTPPASSSAPPRPTSSSTKQQHGGGNSRPGTAGVSQPRRPASNSTPNSSRPSADGERFAGQGVQLDGLHSPGIGCDGQQQGCGGWQGQTQGLAAAGLPIMDIKAVQNQLLRDVLIAMLGHQAMHVDHYRLEVQTVKELSEHAAQQAAILARKEANALHIQAVQEAVQMTEREMKIRMDKEVQAVKAAADRESQDLRSQLDKACKDLTSLTNEKRALLAKAGQQGRDKRELSDALQSAKDKVVTLDKQLLVVKAQVAVSERAKADAERAKAAAEKAASEAEERAKAAEQKLAKDKALFKDRVDKDRVAAEAAATKAVAIERALTQETMTAAMSMVDDLKAEFLSLVHDPDTILTSAGQEVASVRTHIPLMQASLRVELDGLRKTVEEGVAGSRAHAEDCMRRVREKAEEMLRVDKQLASLGPQGLDGLCQEMQQARSQLARASEQCAQLEVQVAAAENAKQSMQMQQQVQQAELSMLVRSQADLQRELVVLRQELERVTSKASTWQARHAQLTEESLASTQMLSKVRTQLSDTERQLREIQAQLANSRSAADSLQSELGRLRMEHQQSIQQCDNEAKTVADQLVIGCAERLRQLRSSYFRPVGPLGLSPQGGGHEGDGATTRRKGGAHQVVEEVETLVGLGLCELSHDQVMGAMESYLRRQHQAAQEALVVTASGEGSTTNGQPAQDDGEAPADVNCREADGGGETKLDPVGRELLWLEGCLLLLLVQLRQKEHELSSTATAAMGAEGGVDMPRASRGVSKETGSRPESASGVYVQGLVAQMMRAMASEKRKLQQQVSSMGSQAPGMLVTTPPAPFLAYLPFRRSVSARTPTPDMMTTTTTSPHAQALSTPPHTLLSPRRHRSILPGVPQARSSATRQPTVSVADLSAGATSVVDTHAVDMGPSWQAGPKPAFSPRDALVRRSSEPCMALTSLDTHGVVALGTVADIGADSRVAMDGGVDGEGMDAGGVAVAGGRGVESGILGIAGRTRPGGLHEDSAWIVEEAGRGGYAPGAMPAKQESWSSSMVSAKSGFTGMAASLAGITARQVVRQGGLGQPHVQRPVAMTDLDDDVLHVLKVLDDSGLRASRGLMGVAGLGAGLGSGIRRGKETHLHRHGSAGARPGGSGRSTPDPYLLAHGSKGKNAASIPSPAKR